MHRALLQKMEGGAAGSRYAEEFRSNYKGAQAMMESPDIRKILTLSDEDRKRYGSSQVGDACALARNLIGATDGVKAAPGTIRGDYAISVQNNLVHGSDSAENAGKEIALWFKAEELVTFTPVDTPWVAGG